MKELENVPDNLPLDDLGNRPTTCFDFGSEREPVYFWLKHPQDAIPDEVYLFMPLDYITGESSEQHDRVKFGFLMTNKPLSVEDWIFIVETMAKQGTPAQPYRINFNQDDTLSASPILLEAEPIILSFSEGKADVVSGLLNERKLN